jgi:hypothetical protein
MVRNTGFLFNALMLCVTLLATGGVAAAPLKVVGRFLQDTRGAYDIGIYPAAGRGGRRA